MSRTQFFPYPVAESALGLRYELHSEQLHEDEHGRILAVDLPDPEAVRLAIEVEIATGTFEHVLPEEERDEPPVDVVVALRSVTSRERQAVRMGADDGVWRGVLDIPKQDLYGELALEPMLVRRDPGENPDYAVHRGAMLATGEPVKVLVDEPPLPAGGFIEIKFENFRESGNRRRAEKPNLLYMLDTNQETPILWLNEGVDEFKTVMHARGPRGYNLRVRDAMFDTIVSQVWTSLASLALSNLALLIAESEGDDESDPMDSLPEWQQRVISFWAPHLFPLSRAEAIDQVLESASQRQRLGELFDELSIAVQQWAGTGRAFRGLIRLRDREGV